MITLLCTVRNCGQPLARETSRLFCARGHSFDIARSGYCNLLQPQDSRSRHPGDSRTAVMARRRFLDRGVDAPLLDRIAAHLALRAGEALLDVGCGEGHHLAALQERFRCDSHGIDISVAAIDAAARRHRDCQWIVGNADRFLPYADGSFAALTSITSRLNVEEFRRVLREDGRVVIVLPGVDDLIELREAILGAGKLIDRSERVYDQVSTAFTVDAVEHLRQVIHLDREAIHDVMESSYRGLRTSQHERLEAIDALDVTMSRELFVLRPR